MYGSVLGASVTAGSVAVLPHTGGSTLSVALTLTCLTAGVVITAISAARILANKYFA
ncbi:MAG TPA: hypothetical protein VLF90_01005 [Patescibacteria group bacterium]|nr:hypothetical protein [Patescibacteria group bacterium]